MRFIRLDYFIERYNCNSWSRCNLRTLRYVILIMDCVDFGGIQIKRRSSPASLCFVDMCATFTLIRPIIWLFRNYFLRITLFFLNIVRTLLVGRMPSGSKPTNKSWIIFIDFDHGRKCPLSAWTPDASSPYLSSRKCSHNGYYASIPLNPLTPSQEFATTPRLPPGSVSANLLP